MVKTFGNWIQIKEMFGTSSASVNPFLNSGDDWLPVRSSHGKAFARKTDGGYLVATDDQGSHQAFVSDFKFNKHWKMI